MSFPRKKLYGCFVTAPCAYLRGGRACICLYTHKPTQAPRKWQPTRGGEPSGAIFCQELRLPVTRQRVNRGGLELVNHRGCGQIGGISAPLAGPPAFACRLLALLRVKGSLQPLKEPHACAPIAVLCTHSIGMLLAEAHKFLKVWLLSPRYHFLFARALCPCFTLFLLFLSRNSSSPSLPVYHVGCQELCQSLSQQDPLPSYIKSLLTTGKTDPLGLSAGQSLASPCLKGNNVLHT